MKFTLEVNLGNSKLIVEQECDGIKGLFREASIFSTFPSECNNCQSGNLALNERKTAKGEYYEITCQDCGYRKEYGQYKDGDNLFPKDWNAPYEADGESSSDSKSSSKKSGKSALQKAKEAKLAKAQKEEQEETEYENTDSDSEETEEKVEKKAAPKTKSRSSILDKYKKKKSA